MNIAGGKDPKLVLEFCDFQVEADFLEGSISTAPTHDVYGGIQPSELGMLASEMKRNQVIADGGELRQGDYCLGTRWTDGDSNDPFAVGILGEITTRDAGKTPWYYFVDANGQRLKINGFRKVVGITRAEGDYILNNLPGIEKGFNSLWLCLSNYRAGFTYAGISKRLS